MIRAYVHEGYTGDLSVSVVMHPPEGSMDIRPRVHHLGDGMISASWEEIPEDRGIERPTFCVHRDEARAILDALAVHFGGAEDTRALRRDYDAERQRVDTLAATLSTLALKLADPA